jgi:hypothetical protein
MQQPCRCATHTLAHRDTQLLQAGRSWLSTFSYGPFCFHSFTADAALAFELAEKVLRDKLGWLMQAGAGLKGTAAAALGHALRAAAAEGQPGQAPGGTAAAAAAGVAGGDVALRAPGEELLEPFPAHVLVSANFKLLAGQRSLQNCKPQGAIELLVVVVVVLLRALLSNCWRASLHVLVLVRERVHPSQQPLVLRVAGIHTQNTLCVRYIFCH